jgi:hypothetical protein
MHCVATPLQPGSGWTRPRAIGVAGGRIFAATVDERLISTRVFTDTDDLRWERAGHANGVLTLTGTADARLFGVTRAGLWWRPATQRSADWVLIGPAPSVVSIAANDGWLYAVTDTNRLLRRSASTSPSARWVDVHHAEAPVSLACDGDRLVLATAGGGLWWRPADGTPTNWQLFGHAHSIRAIAVCSDWLFAVTTDDSIWKRSLAYYEQDWQRVDRAGGLTTLAGQDGQLFGTTPGAGELRVTRPFPRWEQVGPAHNVLRLAGSKEKLWGLTRDWRLWRRSVTDDGGLENQPNELPPHLSLVPHFLAIAADEGGLWSITEHGYLYYTPEGGPPAVIDDRANDIHALTVSGDWLYGATAGRHGRLMRRRRTTAAVEEGFRDVGHVANAVDLAAHEDALLVLTGRQMWWRPASDREVKWKLFYPVAWERPATWYPLDNPMEVRVGINPRNPDVEALAVQYNYPVQGDIGLFRLDAPIPAPRAVPLDVRVDGDVSSAAPHRLHAAGYGGVEDLQTVFVASITRLTDGWSPQRKESELVALAAYGGELYAATKRNRLLVRPFRNASDWEYVHHANGIVCMTATQAGRLFVVTRSGSLWWRRADHTPADWTRVGSEPVAIGVTALAAWDGFLYAATEDDLLLRRPQSSSRTDSWEEIHHAHDVTAMTAWGGELFAVNGGLLWRRPADASPSSWMLAPRPGFGAVTALAVQEDQLLALSEDDWPIRQRAEVVSVEYPFGSLLNMLATRFADSAELQEGDSGSPLIFRRAGTRSAVVAVAQGVEANGGRYTATSAHGGTRSEGQVAANVAAWLRQALH